MWKIAAVGEAPLFVRWVRQQLRTSQLVRRDDRLDSVGRNRSLGCLKHVAFTIEKAAKDALTWVQSKRLASWQLSM